MLVTLINVLCGYAHVRVLCVVYLPRFQVSAQIYLVAMK